MKHLQIHAIRHQSYLILVSQIDDHTEEWRFAVRHLDQPVFSKGTFYKKHKVSVHDRGLIAHHFIKYN